MSGGPKTLHEEGSHPTTSKCQRGEIPIFPHLSGKLTHSVVNDYHQAFEHGHDGQFPQVQWIEPRDGDKRSSVLSSYGMPSSSDSYVDHPVVSENRLELRESKDNRGTKIENREMKDFSIEARLDSQASRGEKDVLRSESRGDDKGRKSDKESKMDFKVETKIENDGYTVGSSHVNGNEAKENHREKRYTESPSDGAEPWRFSRNNLHSSSEIGREALATEEREYSEAHEAVGENKIDLKVEDKFKGRERKKKDEKHRDSGEKDKDQNDRRNSLQFGSTSTECHEPIREEREIERWDRENGPKDKERVMEKERDYVKRERPVVNEKENLHHEKELVDGSVKIAEQENSALEQKKLDIKDRKREKDLDVEGDRHEKHARCYNKESNDGCAEGDGATERDREGFGYGIQQRRRILRPRGTTQAANCEPHFCSRARDGEGSQGKHEVSSVVYKPGECMQELLKLWKEYEASEEYKNDESSQNGPTLEIRIPAEYVAATNRQVRGSQLWGADIYTDDSDLVAVLMHTGYCRPTVSSPPPSIHELCATIRVLPPQDSYTSTLRNSVCSRAWGAAIGCSYRVESCCIVKKGGGTIDLEPCLTNMSAVEPTLAPVAVERAMTTRAAASNALRQQRFIREVTIQYNLCNEPWLKYNISVVADKGLKKPLYTSARLKKGEVLYLETQRNRYELCFNGEKTVSNGTMASCQAAESESEKLPNHTYHGAQTFEKITTDQENSIDVFRWSHCKKPLPQKIMHSVGIPLPVEHLEVLEENLDWEDIQWSQAGVWIAGKAYALARVHFLSPN